MNKQSIYLSIYLHLAPASSLWYVLAKYQFMLIMIITFTFSIVNCTKEKNWNFFSKSNIKSPLHLTRKSISFDFSLWRKEERQDLHTPFQQMNKQLSQLLHIHLSLLYKDFPSHFKLNKGKSFEIYCQWRWIILSIRLLTIRMEIVIDINSSLFANCCSCTFFLLSNWQVSDCDLHKKCFKVCMEAF